MRRRHVIVVVGALMMSACGGSETATAGTYSSETSGISIDIPDNYEVIDDTTQELPDLLADTDLSENAQMVIAGTLSSPLSGFLVWAFDFEAGDETFIPNFNVVRQPRVAGQDAASLRESLAEDYIVGAAAEVLSVEATTVATGEALLVEALFPISGIDEPSTGYQLIAFTDDFTYTLTYSFIAPGEAERAAALRSLASFTAER